MTNPQSDGQTVGQQSSYGSPPVASGDIAGEIKKLQGEVDQARQTKADADNTLADRENRLNGLQAAQRDLDVNQKAYGDAFDKLKHDEKAYRDFRKSEGDGLTELLGPQAAEVNDKADKLKQRGIDLAKAVGDATTATTAAESKRDTAKATAKERGDRSGELKKLAPAATARLALLKTRRDEITKASQAGQYAVAYWLLTRRDFDTVLNGEPKLITPDKLPEALITALKAQGEAERDLAAKERDVLKARDALATARKQLDDHNATGEAALRTELEQMPMTEGAKSNA